ncbi:hypothetical protein K501DRAFT_332511 [Backusella circina FSU 941]|nr:hypothetical protein K501DRAFT_332511 [Backusella circina FSU 941]
MAPFKNLFISKNRKVNFEVGIIIRDIVNVPLVSGSYYVNWKLKHATHTAGSTARVQIKDHQVIWNHPIATMSQLLIQKQNVLGPCELKLEIYQTAGKEIGSLVINLSEYAGLGVATERYLLENCKFNSSIKLTLRMNLKSEGSHFLTPPLSRKQIFKDIPTIIQERKERTKKVDVSHSIKTLHTIRKSQSAMSLPKYCRIQAIDEPSPADLVEQLFATKIKAI